MRKISSIFALFFTLVTIFGESQNEIEYWKENNQVEQDLKEQIKDYLKPDYQIPTLCFESANFTFSGFLRINVTKNQSGLGFIFHAAKGIKKEQLKYHPTIIWLSGGPGISSQYANFQGVGPFYVSQNADQSFNLTENKYSWTNEYNMIFIDQPINTGLSYAEKKEDIPTNQNEVAVQFYSALIELYENENGCFKQLGLNTQDTPLFIYGESYAGKFIPFIAEKIVKEGNRFNLKGIGYFGGFTFPKLNMIASVEFAYENKLITVEQQIELLKKADEGCTAIENQDWLKASNIYFEIFLDCSKNVSYYNIEEQDTIIEQQHESFLNSQFGKEMYQLKLYQQYYLFENPAIFELFYLDFMKEDAVEKVEYLLSQQIYVQILNGELDLLIPNQSVVRGINSLKWKDIGNFKLAETVNKMISNGSKVIGSSKEYKYLSLYFIKDAGHFAYKDQPETSFIFVKEGIEKAISSQLE